MVRDAPPSSAFAVRPRPPGRVRHRGGTHRAPRPRVARESADGAILAQLHQLFPRLHGEPRFVAIHALARVAAADAARGAAFAERALTSSVDGLEALLSTRDAQVHALAMRALADALPGVAAEHARWPRGKKMDLDAWRRAAMRAERSLWNATTARRATRTSRFARRSRRLRRRSQTCPRSGRHCSAQSWMGTRGGRTREARRRARVLGRAPPRRRRARPRRRRAFREAFRLRRTLSALVYERRSACYRPGPRTSASGLPKTPRRAPPPKGGSRRRATWFCPCRANAARAFLNRCATPTWPSASSATPSWTSPGRARRSPWRPSSPRTDARLAGDAISRRVRRVRRVGTQVRDTSHGNPRFIGILRVGVRVGAKRGARRFGDAGVAFAVTRRSPRSSAARV